MIKYIYSVSAPTHSCECSSYESMNRAGQGNQPLIGSRLRDQEIASGYNIVCYYLCQDIVCCMYHLLTWGL